VLIILVEYKDEVGWQQKPKNNMDGMNGSSQPAVWNGKSRGSRWVLWYDNHRDTSRHCDPAAIDEERVVQPRIVHPQ
jgi:hypothetical protein